MANNRMYLVNEATGEQVYIGKYYPSTGWYVDTENLSEKMDKAFDRSEEDAPGGCLGDTRWSIQYESVNGLSNDSVAQATIGVLKALCSKEA